MPYISEFVPNLASKFIDHGRYQLINVLGSGAYGVVYRSRERIPNSTQVAMRAIKVVPHFADDSVVSLQMREASLHKIVSGHRNVITLQRVFRDKKFIYIVMDYCPGGDLYKVICKKRTLPRNDTLVKHLFLQILDGVDACHTQNVFHRDLKPENIIVSEDLTKAWVGDFGLATTSTESISFKTGSKYYMSPECVGSNNDLACYNTRRNDIWALGLILLHLVTGRLPWYKATIEDPCYAAFLDDPDFLRVIFPISEELNNLIRNVLTPTSSDTLPLSHFRRGVRNMDTFWMSEEEVAASNPTVQRMWESYSPLETQVESWSSGSEWEGDDLDSDTSSESSCMYNSDTDSLIPVHSGLIAQTQSRDNVQDACVENAPVPYTSDDSPSQPAPPETRPKPRAYSSDEFPIRQARNPASKRGSTSSSSLTSSSSSGSNAPLLPLNSDSSGSSDSEPATPETRPQDPPDVVVAEPLDQPEQKVDNRLVFQVKPKGPRGKFPGRARIGGIIRQMISPRKAC